MRNSECGRISLLDPETPGSTVAHVMAEVNGSTESMSVVIPFRGSGLELRRQVSAVAGQIDPTIDEVVVVLNGESPENETWLRSSGLPGVRVVHALERAGASYARNVGAAHARGRIIAFTDADDIVQPGWVSGIREAFVSSSHIQAVVGSQRNRVDGVSSSSGFQPPVTLPGGHLLMQSNNLAVLRETFERLSGFDETLPYCEDRDFSFRFADAGLEYRFAANVQVDRFMPYEIRRAARKQANYTWWGHVVNRKHGRRGRSRLLRSLIAVCVRAPFLLTRSRMGRSMLGSSLGVIVGEARILTARVRSWCVWRIQDRRIDIGRGIY